MIWLLIVFNIIIIGGVVFYYKRKFFRAEEKISTLNDLYKKTLHQKKSSEVRLGRIGEQMFPFFPHYPYDPNNFRFLGSPVDGVQFNDDEVIFIEVKTGKSRLSAGQKNIKQLINTGKIKFATFRIDEDKISLKIED